MVFSNCNHTLYLEKILRHKFDVAKAHWKRVRDNFWRQYKAITKLPSGSGLLDKKKEPPLYKKMLFLVKIKDKNSRE